MEQEVEASAVNYQPREEKFTPENYANWFRKVITEQWKGQLHPTFPHNSLLWKNNNDFKKNPTLSKFFEIIRVAPFPKKGNGKIDWIQALAREKKYWEPFQKIETYQAVKSYLEQTLNPALTANEAALLSVFPSGNLPKLNQLTTERAILVITGNNLLNFCASEGSIHFPTKKFGFGASTRKKKNLSFSDNFGSTDFTEKFEFSSAWGSNQTSPPPNPIPAPIPKPTPPPPPSGLSSAELEARGKCLEKNGNWDEKKLLPLLKNIQYRPDEDSSVEKWMDLRTELLKQKQVNFFTTVPQISNELKKGYEEIKKTKREFVELSLIPRKPNGDIDWINYWTWLEKKPSFSVAGAEDYLKNKTNKTWEKYFGQNWVEPASNAEEVVELNKQLNYYIEHYEYANQVFNWLVEQKPELKFKIWYNKFILIKKFTGGKEVALNWMTNRYIDPPPNS